VDRLAAGLISVILLPLAVFLAYLYVQNAKRTLPQQIEDAEATLRAAKQGLPPLEAKLTAARQALEGADRGLIQARAAYEALRKEDLFWRSYQEARALYDDACRAYEQTQAFLASQLGQLSQRDWRGMKDEEFETHLMNVFECLGYSVQMTSAKAAGTQGDRGADLLVCGRGHRFAIQAKGHAPDNHVGPKAVRDAHFAMTPWQCDRCAVITTSYLTRPALKDAAEVDCLVIDGDGLPSLLRGEHPEFPNLTALG
jgi:hypothetical protein